MCSHLNGFTEKALHFSVCNKSLSIYLFLPISSLSTDPNERPHQIFITHVIKQRAILGPSFDI